MDAYEQGAFGFLGLVFIFYITWALSYAWQALFHYRQSRQVIRERQWVQEEQGYRKGWEAKPNHRKA